MNESEMMQIVSESMKGQERPAKNQSREAEIQEAAEAVIYALEEYRASIWCEVLARVVLGVFSVHLDAMEMRRETMELRAEQEK